MNHNLKITILSQPQPKQRSRKGKHGNWYNPQSEDMNIVRNVIGLQLPANFKTITKSIPVRIDMVFFIKPSKTKATNKFIEYIQYDDIPHTQKLDIDNANKFFLDCMSQLVFYDDCQVYAGMNEKYWSINPRTEITVLWSE